MRPAATLIFLLALPAMLAAPAFGQEGDEQKLKMGDRDDALKLKVNNAIRAGIDWLKSKQMPDGSWKGEWAKFAPPYQYPMGETALSLLALLKSGVSRHDDCIKKGFEFLRPQPLKKTYEVSVLIMALQALYADNKPAPVDHDELTRAVRKKVPIGGRDMDWMKECVRFLLENRTSSMLLLNMETTDAQNFKDVWHYPMTCGDHSNTQFAILGLKAASKCGIRIPEDVWILTLKHFLRVQEADGPEVRRWKLIEDRKHGYVSYKPLTQVPDHARGWCYGTTVLPKTGSADKATATTGSMTCVGVSNLTIALSELGRACPKSLRDKAETGVHDGMAWLDHNWKIDCNPHHPEKLWHYYYLYGLERVGVLTWSRHIGKHDWYREGAEFLVAHQQGGKWDDPNCPGPINNTCFALLFLTRATVPGRMVITGQEHRRHR